jgi:putative peptidoglycan lipid II flippase
MKRSLLVSFIEIINVIVQFGYFLQWGLFFGARPEMDAFLTSMALPAVLIIVTTGPLISSLVPLLVEAKEGGSGLYLTQFKNNLLNLFTLGGFVLTIIFFAGSDIVIRLIAPGMQPELRNLSANMLRIELCCLPMAIASGVLISFHYAEEKFFRPTLATIFSGLAAILLLVLLQKQLGIYSLAWGFVLNNLLQLLLLSGIVKHYSWQVNWSDKGLRQLFKRMLPLTCGNIYFKSDTIVAITQVLTRGFVTTRFTEMSQTYLQGPDRFRLVFNELLERTSYVFMPVVFTIIMFSQNIVHFLLERGAFTAADTRHTALVLIALIGVIIGGMLGSIMANSFYAAGDTKTITIFAIVSFTIGIGLKIAGARLFSFYGIALATSLYFMLTPIIGFTILQRKLKVFAKQKTGRHLVKILLAGTGSFLFCYYSLPKISLGFWLLPVGISLLFLLYQLLAMALQVDEAWKLWKEVKGYGAHLLRW